MCVFCEVITLLLDVFREKYPALCIYRSERYAAFSYIVIRRIRLWKYVFYGVSIVFFFTHFLAIVFYAFWSNVLYIYINRK